MARFVFCLILLIGMFNQLTIANNPEKLPNVIVILTDDQGYGDLSCHGNPILETPAMDRLYDEAVRFTDFHVSSICTPTRSQLLTGLDACRNGAFAWAYSREIIHAGIPLLPEIFKENGYATGHFGKWHLGDNYPNRPIDRGFDESVKHGGASIFQTPDYWNNDYLDDYYEHNGNMEQYKGYCTDVWFDEAMKFMKNAKNSNKPFFVYLPTNAPHGPLIVEPEYSKPYLDRLKNGYVPEPEFENGKISNEVLSWFYGMISNIDKNMERLDIFLHNNELYKNTIFIFMTDNGGTAGVRVFNAGMRGSKASLYDGGHRVPFFIRWPEGGLLSNESIDVLCHSQDLLPTLIDLCHLKTKHTTFDGVSLKSLLTGKSKKIPDRILVMQNAQAPETKKYNATVLWDKWRLVNNAELYNITTDSKQKIDVAAGHPEIVKKMQSHYENWWQEIQESINKIPYIPIGGDNCKTVTLTCFDWFKVRGNGNVTVQPTIRKGVAVEGSWNITILQEGLYELNFSRWPKEANTEITGGIPAHKTLTITYPEGQALPISHLKYCVDDENEKIDINNTDKYATLKVNLEKGEHVLSASFYDKDDNLVCGAYYAYVSKISNN